MKRITPFSYSECLEYLIKMSNLPPKKQKLCYLVMGPNGSGKSTLIANLFSIGKVATTYINADLIKYKAPEMTDVAAMLATTYQVKEYIDNGYSFCYETVFSHPSKLDLIEYAKNNGYTIITMFVYTQHPHINCARVRLRQQQGGHKVAQEKIISRYYRCLANFTRLAQISSEVHTFDNTNLSFLI